MALVMTSECVLVCGVVGVCCVIKIHKCVEHCKGLWCGSLGYGLTAKSKEYGGYMHHHQ